MGGTRQSLVADVLAGAVAGGLATAAMGVVSSAIYEREDPSARRREDRARGGKSAHEVAADRVARLAGLTLDDRQRAEAGTAFHYGLGVSAGALYGATRRRIAAPPVVRGLAFGAALWLVADEGMTPALGLTPGPGAFPWQTHARGLAAHLTFGLAAEGVLSVLDRFRASPPASPAPASLGETPSAAQPGGGRLSW